MAELVNVVVCTQARSGSQWFGRLLHERGFMMYREAFNPLIIRKRQPEKGTFKEKFYEDGQSNKDKDFVTKMMADQIFFDMPAHWNNRGFKRGGPNLLWKQIINQLPHERTAFIRLVRKDTFACARSQRGATTIQSWKGSTQDILSKEEISLKNVAWVDLQNALWDYILHEPHVVYYENLVDNTEDEIQKVVDYIEWVRRK